MSETDLLDDKPIQTGSTGVTFLYVPLRTPEIVDRVQPNWSALPALESGVFVFAPGTSVEAKRDAAALLTLASGRISSLEREAELR